MVGKPWYCARFINHSCSPNLFGYNVIFDHDDGRISHIILFAVEDIHKCQNRFTITITR